MTTMDDRAPHRRWRRAWVLPSLALGLGLAVACAPGLGCSAASSVAASSGAGGSDNSASASIVTLGVGSNAMSSGSAMTVGPRPLPDATEATALFVGRLPTTATPAQLAFAATHYVGARRLTRSVADAVRLTNPSFVALHEHLGLWQATADLEFLIDGETWGSDYALVTGHDPWFWHEPMGARVASKVDGKWLMNVGSTDYAGYWYESVGKQAAAADDDGVFASSAGPMSIVADGLVPDDPRLAGHGIVETTFPEFGDRTFSEAWSKWATNVGKELAARQLPVFFDVGSLGADWDTTNYAVATGLVVDMTPSFSASTTEWIAWMNRVLPLAGSRPTILRARLSTASDIAQRKYFLALYHLLRGPKTYLDCSFASALEWYPEWEPVLGAPLETHGSIDAYVTAEGAFARRFAHGRVFVNPTETPLKVSVETPMRLLDPKGGGTVFAAGETPGSLAYKEADTFLVAPHAAQIAVPFAAKSRR